MNPKLDAGRRVTPDANRPASAANGAAAGSVHSSAGGEKPSVQTESARTHTAEITRRGPGRPPNPKPPDIPPAAAPQAPQIILGPDFADNSLKFFGGAMALVAHALTKVPFDDCEKILGFSTPQRAMMTPALAPVLDKYLGEWIRTHQAEVALLLLATPIVTSNLMTFAAVARAHKNKMRGENSRSSKPSAETAPVQPPAQPATSAPAPATVM